MLLCLGDFSVEGLGHGCGCRFTFEVITQRGPRTPSIMPEDAHTAAEGGREAGKNSTGYWHSFVLGEQQRGNDLFQEVGTV